MSEIEFIKTVGPLATADMKKTGVLASVTIAQAILESGYGTTDLARNASNFFGMKCSLSGNTWASAWDGVSKYTKKTAEQKADGTVYYVTADFRKYPDIETSINDHSLYLVGAKNGSKLRYEGLVGETDPKTAAQIIKGGGYATDATYVDKLCNIIDRYDLTQYDVQEEVRDMNIVKQYSVNNDCYKANVNKADSRYTTFQNRGPRGLMLHSVGCPQPKARVFANTWNKSGGNVAVHAVLQADGTVIQCLPWNFRGWHAGGDANNTHVGVEMTEPDCIKYTGGSSFTCSDLAKAQTQVKGTYETAVKLFAQLCTQYGLDPMTAIISHKEGHNKGLASNHGDPEHLWNGLKMGYTMDTFRRAVKSAMSGGSSVPDTAQPETPVEMYRVRKSWADSKSQVGAYKVLSNAKVKADETGLNVYDSSGKCVYTPARSGDGTPFMVRVTIKDLNIRKGPGYKTYASVGYCPVGTYTIVETKVAEGYTWGRLKSGAGWIALEYAQRV